MFDKLLKSGLPILADIAIEKGEEYVKSLVKDKLGVDLDDDIPASKLESLQEFDLGLELERESNRHDEKIFEDVQDARELYKENVKARNHIGEWFMYIITLIVVLGGGGALIFASMETGIQEFIKPLVTAAVFFWLGSSQGSKQKDAQAHEQAMAKVVKDEDNGLW
jgi:hypothetical protein